MRRRKKRPSRSALSLSQLLEQLKSGAARERSATRTEINKRFSFPFSCIAFALIGVPLGITTHRRETSVGFATGLIVAIFYFLFIIIADTMRANAKIHPELLVWFPERAFHFHRRFSLSPAQQTVGQTAILLFVIPRPAQRAEGPRP